MKDASSDLAKVTAWWRTWPEANAAVACGRDSGIVVIDIDPRNGGSDSWQEYISTHDVPNTLTSLTGGGGQHLIFTYPSDITVGNRGNWLPGVDVKSDGGYIIVPPSSHKSGASYRWANWPESNLPAITPIPSDLAEQVVAKSTATTASGGVLSIDGMLEGVTEGSRDDTFFRWACSYRRINGEDSKSGAMVLALVAAQRCSPPFPPDQVQKCVDSAWRQDHSDAGRPTILLGTGGDHHALTDSGNALRLVDAHTKHVRYVPGWGWMIWQNGRWERDTGMAVERLARKVTDQIITESQTFGDDRRGMNRHVTWAMKSQSAGALAAMERVARSDERVSARVEDFDSDDMLLACRNGRVDLMTGDLLPDAAGSLVTKNTDIDFDPGVDQSRWLEFISSALNNDQSLIDYVQAAAGYTLTGSTKEEVFFIISGPQASGKSTFLDGLAACMGTYSTSTQSDTFMYRRNQQTAKDELARLAGMRMVAMSEIREGEGFNDALIKQVTGGDSISARYLYQDAFEYTPRFKLWIGTNHDPAAKDDALWRRIKKIPFPITVPVEKRDKTLKQYLRDTDEGARAVLAWCVEGAAKWAQGGGLIEPLSITTAISAYRETQDRDMAFMNEVLRVSPGMTSTANAAFVAYRRWAEKYGERAKTLPSFIDMLKTRGWTVTSDNGQFVIDGLTVRQETIGSDGLGWSR